MRPARRPEMKRPVTTDPSTAKKSAKPSPIKNGDIEKSPSSHAKSPRESPNKKSGTPQRLADAPTDKRNDFTSVRNREHLVTEGKELSPPKIRNVPVSDTPSLADNGPPQEEPPDPRERISMTPRAIASRKENLGIRLKVYEDPVGGYPDSSAAPQSTIRATALEELPINEPAVCPPHLSPKFPLLAEESESPLYHRKWINVETAARRVSDSEKTDNPFLVRRILESGITKIRAGTLDVHGFRKLQALIRGGEDIWEDGVKFDELLLPLLETLESPHSADSKSSLGRAQDLKTQLLITIRLLQQHQKAYFSGYYPRALSAIVLARKHHHATSHIVCGLEEAAETIVAECDPVRNIDAVLDLLETEPRDESDTLFMGLYILAGLLHRVSATALAKPGSADPLTSAEQNQRLGNVAARCLKDANPDVRRAVVEYALELHDAVRDKPSFWALIGGVGEDHRSLITYYLARREKAHERAGKGSTPRPTAVIGDGT